MKKIDKIVESSEFSDYASSDSNENRNINKREMRIPMTKEEKEQSKKRE